MAFNFSPRIVTNGLVLYLDAANSNSYVSGSTTWNDISRGGNNGTLVGGFGYNSGNAGSLVFNGGGNYVNLGKNSMFDLGGKNFTISLFFNCSGWNSYFYWTALFTKGDSSWRLHKTGNNSVGNLEFATNGLSPSVAYWNAPFTANQWYYITCTYGGGVMSLYSNGILDNSTNKTGTITNNSANTYIGENSESTGRYFPGKVSTLQMYNRALSSAEVLQNYNAQKTRFGLT